MKKYLFGTLAIAIAIGAAAFTTSANRTQAFVQFVGNPLIQTDVQDQTQWEQVVGVPSCDFFCRKACRIQIDDSKLIANPGGPLLPKVLDAAKVTSINASHCMDNINYVPVTLHGTPGSYLITNEN
ncbi:hypothetical protein HHL16_19170 [Pseudoflavitalea sp. G-6-1-2]|uniref:hypothetical protein n=1 Tax=Pseudoflavitalea sp. G-6-1-2 TaxID=2728841 RepID=UPI00146CAD39|nr:hypothetical protein [Pseudoflavitalea sp. G-6-1-2]NML23007.1 hypothetical protein [Pseudoflavitalea sp. G-6-1-2]